ncbi:MAG: carboxypeptidase regulatory-like domain-containing protein [Acidobacteria bacterium]|nr:carboxypeptidase regulatory-like domain-containing protein [Acidobacteriota bacterium]
MRVRARCAGVVLVVALAGPFLAVVGAYSHFVHYPAEESLSAAVVEKFDLDALTDQTVYFFVSRTAPRTAENDSYAALISQVRQALAVWDAVPTSALRVKFGGIAEAPMVSRSPAGEIIFAELPPGVIGLGGPVTRGDARSGVIPIIRSQVILSNDLTSGTRRRPSFSELFFTSLLHETGHALGLQHTLTSSVMSTDVTRATTRALPLGLDDAAGLSVLYPTSTFRQVTGSLTGRVLTAAGRPVHSASVVAIGGGDLVVSALTAPDGAYRIDGLFPGQYRVYTHPLPAATQDGLGPANIVLPRDATGAAIPAGGPFTTVFLGGSQRPSESKPVEVLPGRVSEGNDFRVQPRASTALFNITTFSFPGNGLAGVHPAFLDVTRPNGFILATGPNLAASLRGIQLEVLGEDIEVRRPRPYGFDARFVQIDFRLPGFGSLTPKHLVFHTADDVYVLPSAVRFTAGPAPVIHWITQKADADGNLVWSVQGDSFEPRSQVYFDGLPATTVAVFPFDNEIWVEPPVGGAPGRRAVVTVYNSDGQSSAFTLPDGNVTLDFPTQAPTNLQVSPDFARIDSDVVVRILGDNTNFISGETIVGFGTSDIVTREVSVISPTELLAVATVRPEAQAGTFMLSVATGLNIMSRADAFRIDDFPANTDKRPTVRFGSLVNSATMTADLSPGVWASLFGSNLAGPDASAVRVTLNDEPCRILSAAEGQINLQIPFSAAIGSGVLQVDNGVAKSEPMLVRIAEVSPGVFGILDGTGQAVSDERPILSSQPLALLATGLGVAAANADGVPAGLAVLINGQRFTPLAMTPVEGAAGLYRVFFEVPPLAFTAPRAEVALQMSGKRSNAVALAIGAPEAGGPTRGDVEPAAGSPPRSDSTDRAGAF